MAGACALATIACDSRIDRPVPPPPPPSIEDRWGEEHGFPIKQRSACTQEVVAAVRAADIQAVRRLAAEGASFTCGANDEALPLAYAIWHDRPELVRALLEAGADPNARWGDHGDRFALQTAIERLPIRSSFRYEAWIIRLLLQYGADPNARWCPGDTRRAGPGSTGCESERSATPLMFAALANDAEVVFLLLDAGADPTYEDHLGADALDYASSEATFFMLLGRVIPASEWKRKALAHLERSGRRGYPALWDRSPLGRAIAGTHGAFKPGPDLSVASHWRLPPYYLISRAGLVRALIALGADPNQRLGGGIADWTPLSLAILSGDREVIETLLDHGADPNMRWCFPLDPPWSAQSQRRLLSPSGCNVQNGMTPLMFAADRGGLDLVAVLLSYGADPRVSDWQNRTAREYAAGTRAAEIVRVLSGRRPNATRQ
jgi:ankyrin repeat protein